MEIYGWLSQENRVKDLVYFEKLCENFQSYSAMFAQLFAFCFQQAVKMQ